MLKLNLRITLHFTSTELAELLDLLEHLQLLDRSLSIGKRQHKRVVAFQEVRELTQDGVHRLVDPLAWEHLEQAPTHVEGRRDVVGGVNPLRVRLGDGHLDAQERKQAVLCVATRKNAHTKHV